MNNKKQKNIEAIYPLSPMQQGMLFHTLYEPGSSTYFEQIYFNLIGDLDVKLFQQALQKTVDRHAVLRTSFVWKKLDKLLQVVHKDVELPFTFEDWRTKSKKQQEQDFQKILSTEKEKGFDLAQPQLIRVSLFQITDTNFQILWNNHHILFDGWSVPVIFKDVFTYYEMFRLGHDMPLPPAKPFREYVAWLQKQDLKAAENYWSEKLKGLYAPTPLGFQESNNDPNDYGSAHFLIEKEATEKLNTIATQNQVTLNTVIQAAWSILLSRFSDEKDILFGATVSGRPPQLSGVESMVGLFINTLPVRVDLSDDKNISALLKEIQKTGVEIRDFEYSPLVQVQQWSDIKNKELFKSIVVFENYPVEKSMQEQQLSIKADNFKSFEQTNFPLTVAVAARDDMTIDFAFQKPLFSEDGISRLFCRLKNVLLSFIENPNQKISQVSILDKDEAQFIINEFNQAPIFEIEKSIIELFEESIESSSQKTALIYAGHSNSQASKLTYLELNQKANQLAHFLVDQKISPEEIIAISLRPGIEMIVAMFAIMKAGGAFLPIDPEYPEERLNYIIADSEINIVLTQADLKNKFESVQNCIVIDTIQDRLKTYPQANPGIYPASNNLAYMIYTSGSTGQPKGTMCNYAGIVNLVKHLGSLISHDKKTMLQFASTSFDASIYEIFGALYTQSTLVLADREQMIPGPELVNVLKENKVTNLTLPPSVLSLLREEYFPDLKNIVSGGEALSPDLARHWANKNVSVINAYGPTENAVCSTTYVVDINDFENSVPIGKPLSNNHAYILDEQLNIVPVGFPGELHFSGKTLARGYYNRPSLTSEKFIPNPFSKNPGERLYKTGDLCRYRKDGHIEFLGRIDNQVKVRGFRIELGEIEFAINEITGINDCIVIVRENEQSEPAILAYYIPADNSKIGSKEIRESLRLNLPEYMVPSAFVEMSSFPLTTHKKIDKKALPEPDLKSIGANNEFVTPRNASEETLAVIWSSILGIEKISVFDNFFDLGGHSLLATKLIARIREAFAIDLPLRNVFENNTIDLLSRQIEIIRRQESDQQLPEITRFDRTNDIPVSLPQQRLWFIDQFSKGNAIYNIPFSTKIKGDLDVTALEKSINQVIARHESLRTSFTDKKGIPFQNISDKIDFELPISDLQQSDSNAVEQESLKRASEIVNWEFDLNNAPLFKIELFKISNNEHILVAVMHHIISDGWSMSILINEVLQNYSDIISGKDSELTDLPIQYADFAAWQQSWLKGPVLEKQISYWKEHLGLSPGVLELNTDFKRPAVQTFNGKNITFTINKELADGIRSFGKKEGLTNYVTLMALFQLLMNRYSGQKQILVGTPVAGRHHSTTQDLIGFFVNTLVIKADFEIPQTFIALAKQIRENMLDAYAHQDVPFEQLVDALQIERDLAHSPLFQVAFIPQDAVTKLPEIPTLDFDSFGVKGVIAKYDLSVYFSEFQDKFIFNLEYNSDLFKRETIDRLASHYQMLLQKIVEEPKSRVDQVEFLSLAEKSITETLNSSDAQFDSHLCAHQRFEKVAEENPENTALVFAKTKLSYGELNQKANQLAHLLIEKGIGFDDIIGIHMNRSLEMVIAMLATMKAGAAYLPLDPSYPQERLKYMIEDSGLKVLLTNQGSNFEFQISNFKLINIENEQENLKKSADKNLNLDINPDNLAYVIYTSGSTGKPKGTMLSHTGLVNLANEQRKAFEIDDKSRILQFASLSFDAATWETVMALLNNAALHLVEREITVSADELVKTLKEQKISTITLPPSVLAVFPDTDLPDLKTIITAGEKCPVEHVKKWQPGRRMVNAYGPTETSVCASMYFTNADEPFDPPIGKNVGNFQLYVLDRNLMRVPIGVSGELCISGVGLARGYLNRPDVTADKFIPNPFSKQNGDRLYKTGDLVKMLPDGNIDFLGRIDQQVKVRGFRIELGEIEASIHTILELKDLYVTVREDNPGDHRITAYTVGENEYDVAEVKSNLLKSLPEYMVPSSFINLEEMPLTPNGKIDKKALPAPEQDRSQLSKKYEAPRNENEEKLALIVSELLHTEKVGIHDSFFELGGHSLLATQFVSRIREEFKVELPLRKLFESPTIMDISNALLSPEAMRADEDEPQIEALDRGGDDNFDELLGELEGLSDEEVQALLDAEEDGDEDREDNG
ncbi:MAG: amino acid adenylation domain-containing protein [Calditrichaeota bacterium]|nr:MAG: amino acid adenylation domain-containing protein [Calditrichota bacterium]MBL1204441.1 amino acid adenylation domain-containing protein [Calditrichota bacterium]NOG44270.1 amino acid adenylation domain-containing protein [Calditrichota bacterium]